MHEEEGVGLDLTLKQMVSEGMHPGLCSGPMPQDPGNPRRRNPLLGHQRTVIFSDTFPDNDFTLNKLNRTDGEYKKKKK